MTRVKNMPPTWLVEGVLLRVARAVSPSMAVNLRPAPKMLMPVAAGAQGMHVAQPGEQPPLGPRVFEDCRLAMATSATTSGSGATVPVAAARRRFFSRAENRAGRWFEPGLVYSFYFYQHFVDLGKYQLDVAVRKFDLTRHLDGQPLQLMMKDVDSGAYAFRLLAWHERLLADAQAAATRELARVAAAQRERPWEDAV
jgi:hypothetical protein